MERFILSLHVAIHTTNENKIGWGNPEFDVRMVFSESTGVICMVRKYQKAKSNLWLKIIIIINQLIEDSLISANALFCLRVLFGATWIYSYKRMAPFDFRTRLSDLYPRMKTFLLVPRRASNHRRTTS